MNTSVATIGAPRQPRDAADAVAAGAPGAEARAEAHKEPRRDHDRQRRLDPDRENPSRRQHVGHGAEQEARREHRAPPDLEPSRANRPPTMPLIPAIRPFNNISSAVDNPMSSPPASPLHGVKSSNTSSSSYWLPSHPAIGKHPDEQREPR